jgi:4-hydroxy-tetrahydrodipicolinate synthase
MLASPIRGIIGAALTPFTDDGKVDYDALAREMEFLVADCDAISIAAVEASEYTVLSLEDRKEVMRRATEIINKRVPVILGASSHSIDTILDLAEHAAAVGGDLIQVLMPIRPWGGQPTISDLVQFFTEVASASPLPIVAYHNPGPGADPPLDAFVRLSEINKVDYFKESSRDITKITRLIEQIQLAGKANYFTTMQPLLTTLMMGGAGATMPPPGTRIGARVVRAFREGDIDKARYWQRCFTLFPGKWGAYGLPPIMKSALKHFGVDIGDPARPYAPVSPRDHAQIGQFLSQIGILGDGEPDESTFDQAAIQLAQEDTFLR